jgi:tetratricopeptide (TPR) repeat protein
MHRSSAWTDCNEPPAPTSPFGKSQTPHDRGLRQPAYGQRSELLLDKGDLKGAIADIQSVTRLNPKKGMEYSDSLVRDLELKKNWNGAIAVRREAVRTSPTNPEVHDKLARVLRDQELDRYVAGLSSDQQAESEIVAEEREAIRLKPADPSFHEILAGALEAKGDSDGAIAEIREAIHLNPDDPWSHFSLAFALKKKGNQFEAAQQEAIAKELSSKARKQTKKPSP